MPTVDEVLDELRGLGSPSIKKVLMKHGAQEPFFGVKVEDLKKIRKRLKDDHELALALYDTGISDAMYLAGLMADDTRMTKKQLQKWLDQASWSMLSEFTVPGVAAGSPHGRELALKWIDSKKEKVAAAGWATLGALVSLKPDDELELAELKQLLQRVQKTIHEQPNRVRYCMNAFVIAVGCFVKSLTDTALKTAKAIGAVHVDMNGTACGVPFGPDYIQKVIDRGTVGKKKKTAKCL